MPRNKTFCKEEVLIKAMELFWEKGFHATSVQDLVNRLGINRASMYETYGNKHDLFDAAIQKYISDNQVFIKDYLSEFSSVKEGLRSLFNKGIENALCSKDKSRGCFVVNMTTELLPGDASIQSVLIRNKKAFEKTIANYIQSGIDSGELQDKIDPKAIARLLFTVNNGIHVVSKLNPTRDELKQLVDDSLSILN